MYYLMRYIKFFIQQKKLGFIGKNVFLSKNIYLKNPQYVKIGNNCYIGPECRIEAWDQYAGQRFNPQIIFGTNVRINSRCHIGAINDVYIGNNTLIGSNVMIIDHSHGKNDFKEMKEPPSKRKLYSKGPVKIGNNCWIGENVCILPNVDIGECSVIGASAVVTKNIPPYSIAVGNPARIVKRIQNNEIKFS